MIRVLLRRADAPPGHRIHVSDRRADKVARLRRPKDRWRAEHADCLLSASLTVTGAGHTYLDSGRPVATVPGYHVSASHDGLWAGAACASAPLGIDIVDVDRFTNLPATPFLTGFDSAHSLLNTADESVIPALVWAAKEAFLKRLGTGLTVDPGHLTVALGSIPALRPRNAVPDATDIRDSADAIVRWPATRMRGTVILTAIDQSHLLAVSGTRQECRSITLRDMSAQPRSQSS